MKNSSFSGRIGQSLRKTGLCLAAFGLIGLMGFSALGVLPAAAGKDKPANIQDIIEAAQLLEPVMSRQIPDKNITKNVSGNYYYDQAVRCYQLARTEPAKWDGNIYPNVRNALYYYYMSWSHYYMYKYTGASGWYYDAVDAWDLYVYYVDGGNAELNYAAAHDWGNTWKNSHPNYAAAGYYFYLAYAYYYWYRFTDVYGYYSYALDLYDLYQYYWEQYIINGR